MDFVSPCPGCWLNASVSSNREHVADSASNKLSFFLTGAAVKADVVGDLRGTFQHHDPVAYFQRFADRMGDEYGRLAVFLDQPDEFRAQPSCGRFVERRERFVAEQNIGISC